MPISAPGNSIARRADLPHLRARGFTLVELMVVIAVIGLASGVAVLAMPDPQGRVLDEAARFAARSQAARDLAIVDSRPVSLWVTPGGYGFDERRAGTWAPIGEKPFRLERWSDGTRVRIAGGGRARLTFDETGLADRPLAVTLTRSRASATARIEADGRAFAE